MQKTYTTTEVAHLCQVSPGSVIRWIDAGKLTSAVTPGGHRRITESDLLHFLKDHNMPLPPALGGDGGKPPSSPLRVLIVDDEASLRKLIRHFFRTEYPGSRVEEADDGFTAGWAAHQLRPHIILLDIRLPRLDGFHACRFIRRMPEMQSTRIIAMTGYGQENEERIRAMGANDFMTKPFNFPELKKRLEFQIARIKKQIEKPDKKPK